MDQQTNDRWTPVWAQPGFRTGRLGSSAGDFDSPLTCGCLARAGPDPEAARTAKDTLVISENAVCCRRCGGGNLGPDPASTSPSREEPPKSEGGPLPPQNRTDFHFSSLFFLSSVPSSLSFFSMLPPFFPFCPLLPKRPFMSPPFLSLRCR